MFVLYFLQERPEQYTTTVLVLTVLLLILLILFDRKQYAIYDLKTKKNKVEVTFKNIELYIVISTWYNSHLCYIFFIIICIYPKKKTERKLISPFNLICANKNFVKSS